jgi:hypothetical protein
VILAAILGHARHPDDSGFSGKIVIADRSALNSILVYEAL